MPKVERREGLSLNCILYNSARLLPRMLDSVKDVVDEIVAVVDARTDDDTVDVLKRYGAKVLIRPFPGSFAELRNQAIDASSGEWILVLDDDEWLEDRARAEIRRLIEARDVDGYRFNRFNFHAPDVWPDRQLRLFKYYGRWRYRVHEVVVGLRNVKAVNLTIYHDPRGRPADYFKHKEALYRKLWDLDVKEGLRHAPYPSDYKGR